MLSTLGFAMAMQFKPDGRGGWLYRQDQIGAAIPVSAAERDGYVRWYGWITLSMLPLYMGAVVVFAVIADRLFPDVSNATEIVISAVGMSAVFAIVYGYLKWFSHAPTRAFADRAALGPALTRKEVLGPRVRRATNGRLVGVTVMLMGVMAIGAFHPDVAPHDRSVALIIALVIPLGVGLGFRWWKWRIDNS